MADIWNMCVHKFYDMVQYREQEEGFPLPQSKLSRFLSPRCTNGIKLNIHIMTKNGSINCYWTVIPLTIAKMHIPYAKRQRIIFLIV